MPARTVRHLVPALPLVLLLVLGACASDGEAASPAPSTTAPASSPGDSLVLSWTDRFEARLANGWVVRDCDEGDRTNVCVYDGDALVGDIELLAGYPLSRAEEGMDARAVARQWAQRMVSQFRDDRADGCAAFSFAADQIVDVTVGGRPGARGGFTLTDRSGRVVERVVNHYAVVDGKMAIVNTDAYVSEGGCLGPTEYDPTFTPAALAQVEPHLDRLLVATPFPSARR